MSQDDGYPPQGPSSQQSKSDGFLPGFASMDDLKTETYKTLTEAIRYSNALPNRHDWNFYNTFEMFPKIMTTEGNNILNLMNTIMRHNNIDSNIKNRILDEKTELVIETNDMILEKVATNIDELNGIKKTAQQAVELQTVSAQLPINGSWNRMGDAKLTVNSPTTSQLQQQSANNCITLITGKNIVRPQTFFKDKIDNSTLYPWQPRITDKPNSLKPLALYLEEYENRQEFCHPYELELERFTPIPAQLSDETIDFPKPIEQTPLIEIIESKQLDELLETLRNCKEFAVDLEHHSYRSFMGITCLMQISVNDRDYLIDTLQLRHELSILNEVFTKPTIVKIFHGADCDIEWLQRDLSIYVVNMFDTHQAAKLLEYSGLSLAYLMKRFCNIVPNKQFQLADWRIRPLPDELKNYAREDTHYLIYIYKQLKKELLNKANNSDKLVKVVLDRSTEICKKRYFKPILTDDSHLDLYRRSKKMFDNRQLYALKEIYAWRDHTAREEDESLSYVLPNHMLLQISESIPREMQGILACCNPIPPLVRSNLLELHKIVLRAREQPLVKPILKEDTSSRGVTKLMSKINMDSPLHCPHDLDRNHEFTDNLPTLLNNQLLQNKYQETVKLKLEIEKPTSIYSIFNNKNDDDDNNNNKVIKERFKQVRGLSYLSPYQRYLLVRPFVQAEEERIEAARREEEEKTEAAKKIEENNVKETRQIDKRTDADRINSVREHYIKLSKQFDEDSIKKKQNEQSLLQMGGTRKRKREFIDEDVDFPRTVVVNDVHTTMPNIRMPPSKKSRRKRNFVDNQDGQGPSQGFNQNSRKRKKNARRKGEQNQNRPNMGQQQPQQHNKHQQQHHQQQQQQWPQQHNKQQHEQRRRFKQQQQAQQQQQHSQQQQQHQQQQQQHSQQQQQHSQQQQQQQQHKQQRQGNKRKQDSSNFTPYDYAGVDFRQFQGGAGSVNTGVNIKHQYKAKGRKRIRNRNTKSSIFGNNNPKNNNNNNNSGQRR